MKRYFRQDKSYPNMSEEDIKYRQGRSRHRVEATEKFAAGTILACIIIIGVLLLIDQLL